LKNEEQEGSDGDVEGLKMGRGRRTKKEEEAGGIGGEVRRMKSK
jgi:hypothetical protein